MSYREINLFHVEPNFTWSGRRWWKPKGSHVTIGR
jgi:hypothetical protein